jgi:hypothetical protein
MLTTEEKEQLKFYEKRFQEQRLEALKNWNLRNFLKASAEYNQNMRQAYFKSITGNKNESNNNS